MKKALLWIGGGLLVVWFFFFRNRTAANPAATVNQSGSTPYYNPTGTTGSVLSSLPASFQSALTGLQGIPGLSGLSTSLQPLLDGINTYLTNPAAASGLSLGSLTNAGSSLLNGINNLANSESDNSGSYNGGQGASTGAGIVNNSDTDGDETDFGTLPASPATSGLSLSDGTPSGISLTATTPESGGTYSYDGTDYPVGSGPYPSVEAGWTDNGGNTSSSSLSLTDNSLGRGTISGIGGGGGSVGDDSSDDGDDDFSDDSGDDDGGDDE